MKDSECPLCGKNLENQKCSVCGYEDVAGVFGDSRDSTGVTSPGCKTKTANSREKKLLESLRLIQEVISSSEPPDWTMEAVASSIEVLHIPMELKTDNKIEFDEKEKRLLEGCHRALESFEAADGGLGQQPEVYIRMGNGFFVAGKKDLSLDYYGKAIHRDPTNEYALYNQALTFFSLQKYQRAKTTLEKLLARNPNSETAAYLKELAEQMQSGLSDT